MKRYPDFRLDPATSSITRELTPFPLSKHNHVEDQLVFVSPSNPQKNHRNLVCGLSTDWPAVPEDKGKITIHE